MDRSHILSVLVENRFGVLSKVSGLFASRGYNIKSLSVGETEDPTISRMTILVEGDDKIIEQVKKQLNKMIDTVKVIDFVGKKSIDKELCFLKINTKGKEKSEILTIASIFKSEVIDIGTRSLTLQICAQTDKINDFLKLLQPFGILEISRSGVVAISDDEK